MKISKRYIEQYNNVKNTLKMAYVRVNGLEILWGLMDMSLLFQ